MSDHGALEGDPKVLADGMRWFFIAGPIAVAFAFFLYSADEMLEHSDREKVLGETLYELRSSQTGLPSRVEDPRVKRSTLFASRTNSERGKLGVIGDEHSLGGHHGDAHHGDSHHDDHQGSGDGHH